MVGNNEIDWTESNGRDELKQRISDFVQQIGLLRHVTVTVSVEVAQNLFSTTIKPQVQDVQQKQHSTRTGIVHTDAWIVCLRKSLHGRMQSQPRHDGCSAIPRRRERQRRTLPNAAIDER